jgi:hypothetical protein
MTSLVLMGCIVANVDEAKVKRLLHKVVDEIFTCFEVNMYQQGVKDTIHKRIDLANLLQDQPACATVKNAKQAEVATAPEGDGNFYT